jgi:hypothetical protein
MPGGVAEDGRATGGGDVVVVEEVVVFVGDG